MTDDTDGTDQTFYGNNTSVRVRVQGFKAWHADFILLQAGKFEPIIRNGGL
jgi:hypothetical protein